MTVEQRKPSEATVTTIKCAIKGCDSFGEWESKIAAKLNLTEDQVMYGVMEAHVFYEWHMDDKETTVVTDVMIAKFGICYDIAVTMDIDLQRDQPYYKILRLIDEDDEEGECDEGEETEDDQWEHGDEQEETEADEK